MGRIVLKNTPTAPENTTATTSACNGTTVDHWSVIETSRDPGTPISPFLL
jgi:hypothetical protein